MLSHLLLLIIIHEIPAFPLGWSLIPLASVTICLGHVAFSLYIQLCARDHLNSVPQTLLFCVLVLHPLSIWLPAIQTLAFSSLCHSLTVLPASKSFDSTFFPLLGSQNTSFRKGISVEWNLKRTILRLIITSKH